MRVMGILAILIIALFVISLSFMTLDDKNEVLSGTQEGDTTSVSNETGDSLAQGLGLPSQQEFQIQYMREQLKNKGTAAELTYQQQIEQSRMEYKNLMAQQRMLHEKDLLTSSQQHELLLKRQDLQKEYMLKQQDSSIFNQGKAYEADMADRLIAFETRKQLLAQQHEETLVMKQNTVFKQSLITYVVVISGAIFLLSLSYYTVSTRTVNKQKELVKLEQDHVYALRQQESMQETRIKVLESISDLPEQDKKEIIIGLVGLNRTFEELEDKVIEEPPIEIELTELTPPQMKIESDKLHS